MCPKHFAVIGDPVEHSLSPAMHNAALQAAGIRARYEAIRVSAGDLGAWVDSEGAVGGHRSPLHGFNVTIPHKETIGGYLHEIAQGAAAVGAVNTVTFRDGRLVGHNTDGVGFLESLSAFGLDVAGQSVVVFGAGGAGRAVVHALATCGASITLVNRNLDKARKVAQRVGDGVRPMAPLDAALLPAVAGAYLLVNATSLGMKHQADSSPVPDHIDLAARTAVVDLVYGRRTPFLRRAELCGCRTMDGLEMLIRQGAAAFRLWNGVDPDLDVMREACRKRLAEVS